MIAVIDKREGSLESIMVRLTSVLNDISTISQQYRKSFATQAEFNAAVKTLAGSLKQELHLAKASVDNIASVQFEMFRSLYRQDSTFKAIVRDIIHVSGRSELVKIESLLEKEVLSTDDYDELIGYRDFVAVITATSSFQYLLVNGNIRGMANFVTWTLAALRNNSSDITVRDGVIKIGVEDSFIGVGIDQIYGTKLALKVGVNFQSKMEFADTLSSSGVVSKDLVNKAFIGSALWPQSTYILQHILLNNRLRRSAGAFTSKVSRKAVRNPGSVRIPDTWYISAFISDRGSIDYRSTRTLNSQPWLDSLTEPLNAIWDLREYDRDIRRLIVDGPLHMTGLNPAPSGAIEMGTGRVIETALSSLLEDVIVGLLDADPLGKGHSLLQKEIITNICGVLMHSSSVASGRTRLSVGQMEVPLRSYRDGIPLFLDYSTLFGSDMKLYD
jgi:hypothetical protein